MGCGCSRLRAQPATAPPARFWAGCAIDSHPGECRIICPCVGRCLRWLLLGRTLPYHRAGRLPISWRRALPVSPYRLRVVDDQMDAIVLHGADIRRGHEIVRALSVFTAYQQPIVSLLANGAEALPLISKHRRASCHVAPVRIERIPERFVQVHVLLLPPRPFPASVLRADVARRRLGLAQESQSQAACRQRYSASGCTWVGVADTAASPSAAPSSLVARFSIIPSSAASSAGSPWRAAAGPIWVIHTNSSWRPLKLPRTSSSAKLPGSLY